MMVCKRKQNLERQANMTVTSSPQKMDEFAAGHISSSFFEEKREFNF